MNQVFQDDSSSELPLESCEKNGQMIETTVSPQSAKQIGISFSSKIILLDKNSLIRYDIYFLILTI